MYEWDSWENGCSSQLPSLKGDVKKTCDWQMCGEQRWQLFQVVFPESCAEAYESTPTGKAVLLWLSWVFWFWCQIRCIEWPWMVFHQHGCWGTMAVIHPPSSRRKPWVPLGGNWTHITLCASSRGMPMGLSPACRPDCWPLTRNPFLEASWNKVQRHHWQLKFSFISICLMYQKIYQHFHSFTHSFIPSKFIIFGKRFSMFFPKCAADWRCSV